MVICLLTINWLLLLEYMFLLVIVGFGTIVQRACAGTVLASESA